MSGPCNAAEMELMNNISAANAREKFDIWFAGERIQEINDAWAKKRKRLDAKGDDPSLRSQYVVVDVLEKSGNHKIVDQLITAQKEARAAKLGEGEVAPPLMISVKGCNYVTTQNVCKHITEKEPDCVKAVLGDEIEADDCADVGEMIKNHKGLTELDLSSNKMGTEGCKAIAAAMAENEHITSLDISGNEIAQGAAKSLAAYLEKSPKLERLLMNGNKMKIYGIEDMMKGMRKNTTLTSLGLFFNGMGEDGVDKLLEVFELPEGEAPAPPPEEGQPAPWPNKNITLLQVEIGDNKATPEQEKKLAAYLEANNKLAMERELERAKQAEFDRLERLAKEKKEQEEAEEQKKAAEAAEAQKAAEAAAAEAAAAPAAKPGGKPGAKPGGKAAAKPGGKAAAGSGAAAAKAISKPDPKGAKAGGKAAGKPAPKAGGKPTKENPGWCEPFIGFNLMKIEADGSNIPLPPNVNKKQGELWKKLFLLSKKYVCEDDPSKADGADTGLELAAKELLKKKDVDTMAVQNHVKTFLTWFRDM